MTVAEVSMNWFGLRHPMSRQEARKLMNKSDVWVKYRNKYKVTTDSNHNKVLFKNLVKRQFADAPVQVCVGDIPYTRTCEGWLFLLDVIDLYVQDVVGWS